MARKRGSLAALDVTQESEATRAVSSPSREGEEPKRGRGRPPVHEVPMHTTTLRLPLSWFEELEQRALEEKRRRGIRHLPVADLIREAIAEKFDFRES